MFGGSSLMFYKMSVQDIYYGYRVLMLSHEKVSPKFFKFHQRFQKTRQNCKQRILEKICILYGCFEVPMYQDNVCTACSIFVLVVLCGSIVYARTSWTYRYYSIETLFYVYRVIPKLCYSYSYFLFYYRTRKIEARNVRR